MFCRKPRAQSTDPARAHDCNTEFFTLHRFPREVMPITTELFCFGFLHPVLTDIPHPIPAGRRGEPGEIERCALFLAAKESGVINGSHEDFSIQA